MKVANEFNYLQRKNQKPKRPLANESLNNTKNIDQLQNTNKFSVPNMPLQKIQNKGQPTAGSLQNGEITEFYYQKLIHIEYQLCLVIFLNMFMVIISSAISFPELKQHDAFTQKGCLYFSLVCFIIQCFLLGFRMVTVLELEKQQKILYEKSTIFSSKKVFYFFAECFIMFVQPYPFFEGISILTLNGYENSEFYLPVNDLLTALSVLRIYVFIRAGLILTPYGSTRSNRLCKMYGCKADFGFSLKCMFKDNPLFLIGAFFTISSMIFAFQIYLVERRAAYLLTGTIGMSNNYTNALWLVLMTITTVGYGDYFPHTSFGRIIILFVAIWGTFIVSMMVVVVSNTLTMEKNQKRTSIIINKLQLRGLIEKEAQQLVGYFILGKQCQRVSRRLQTHLKSTQNITQIQLLQKQRSEIHKKLQQYRKLYNKLEKSFSKLRKQVKVGEDIQDIQDQVSSHFLHVNSDMQILNKNQQKIIQFIHQYLEYNGKRKKGEQGEYTWDQNQESQIEQREQREQTSQQGQKNFRDIKRTSNKANLQFSFKNQTDSEQNQEFEKTKVD